VPSLDLAVHVHHAIRAGRLHWPGLHEDKAFIVDGRVTNFLGIGRRKNGQEVRLSDGPPHQLIQFANQLVDLIGMRDEPIDGLLKANSLES